MKTSEEIMAEIVELKRKADDPVLQNPIIQAGITWLCDELLWIIDENDEPVSETLKPIGIRTSKPAGTRPDRAF